jgi:hypothetical protein
MAQTGEWALLHSVVLESAQRAPQVPDDTHKVPLEQWVKGRLTAPASLGSQATVITRTGRKVTGTLLEVNPRFSHDFGDFVPELLEIDDTVRALVFGGENE